MAEIDNNVRCANLDFDITHMIDEKGYHILTTDTEQALAAQSFFTRRKELFSDIERLETALEQARKERDWHREMYDFAVNEGNCKNDEIERLKFGFEKLLDALEQTQKEREDLITALQDIADATCGGFQWRGIKDDENVR